MNRVRRFFGAGARERWVIVGSFVHVIFYRLALWILPFRFVKRWTSNDGATISDVDEAVVGEIVRGVRFASRFIPDASCLTQALAARKLLARSGQRSDLKIGVSKSDGDLEAHAWLEIDGRIILGKQRRHSRFVVLSENEDAFAGNRKSSLTDSTMGG